MRVTIYDCKRKNAGAEEKGRGGREARSVKYKYIHLYPKKSVSIIRILLIEATPTVAM